MRDTGDWVGGKGREVEGREKCGVREGGGEFSKAIELSSASLI